MYSVVYIFVLCNGQISSAHHLEFDKINKGMAYIIRNYYIELHYYMEPHFIMRCFYGIGSPFIKSDNIHCA